LAFAAPAMPFVVTDGGFADNSIRRRIEPFPVRSTASTRSPRLRRSRSRAGSAERRILPSLGFSRCPLLRRTCGRPLPDRAAFATRSFGPWCHHGFSFRPRGFAPPRRLPPTPQAPSMLQLGAGPGVRRVSRRPGVAPEEASARPAFPAGASPSKGFPSSAAVPGLPGHLPSCRSSSVPLRGRTSLRSSVTTAGSTTMRGPRPVSRSAAWRTFYAIERER